MSTSPNDAGVIAAAPPGGPTPTAQRPPTAGGVGGADAAVSAGAGAWLASLTFALLVAVAGYAWKGAPSLVGGPPPVAAAPARNEPMPGGMDPAQFEALVEKLRVRLQNEPGNAEGWAMLARSYMVIGKPDEALAAFDKATRLSPQDAGLVADHANVLAQREGLAPGGKASALLDRALALDAKQPKALALAGIAAFERQDFATAVRHWEAALRVMPEHPFAPQMRDGIEQAKQAMAQLGSAPAGSAAGAAEAKGTTGDAGASAAAGGVASGGTVKGVAATGGVVTGRVSLAPELAAKASPVDTVFVFARPAEGPRMPLAIVRKQVKDLPFEFRLDDTMALSPQAKLSSHPKVVVGARISKSGNATAQAGDLQGQSEIVDVGSKGLEVRIVDEVGAAAPR